MGVKFTIHHSHVVCDVYDYILLQPFLFYDLFCCNFQFLLIILLNWLESVDNIRTHVRSTFNLWLNLIFTEVALHLQQQFLLCQLVRHRFYHVFWRVNFSGVSLTEVLLKIFDNYIVFNLLVAINVVIWNFESTLFS